MIERDPNPAEGRLVMIIRDRCPDCGSKNFKKNGHIRGGKQNHRCKVCGRQFVSEFAQRLVTNEQRDLVERMLGERTSLHGICRVVLVSMKWLMGFAVKCYEEAPEDLHAQLPQRPRRVLVRCLKAEADELLSFVGSKSEKQWLWLVIDAQSRQAIAYHVGDRSKDSAKALWKKVPAVYRKYTTFLTDGYASYKGVLPKGRHRVVTKKSRLTNHVERLNCTLRQRVSRLVRSTLSFSKKLSNHVGAIRFFLCQYNLELAKA